MGHIVENSTSRLSEPDLKAIADYLRSPAIHESISGGRFMLLFWLLSIAGLLWLAVALTRSKRRVSRDKDSHEKSS